MTGPLIAPGGIVTVVCTGNVARSPALATLLAALRPDLYVGSAAVGAHARPGRRMARPMRQLLTEHGHPQAATTHRARLLTALADPGLVICCAPVHTTRLAALGICAPHHQLDPPVPDPAFGGGPAYLRAYALIREHAHNLATQIGAPR